MPEVRINNWNELNVELYESSWQPDLLRFRSPYVYRGQSDAAYGLETTLAQLGGNYAEMEPHLLRNFRKYARVDTVEHDTLWNWLSLAQHHGLPTRLLDWTISPLVAAHFATADLHKFDRDGVIWAVNQQKCQEYLPPSLKAELDAEGADYFTAEMLDGSVSALADLDSLAPPDFVLFFEPPSIDQRIANQYALFSIMPGPHARLHDWLQDHPDLWTRIVIPAEVKWEIRDKLDQANITERVLFPGLDGLSLWLKRYYTPRT